MVGKGNTYGHPHQETLDKLSAMGIDIYRTDVRGTVIVTTDGENITVETIKQGEGKVSDVPTTSDTQKQSDVKKIEEAEEVQEIKDTQKISETQKDVKGMYVGSIKSDKYHYPTCQHAENILEENEIWFDSAQEAIDKGYVPCGRCKPPRK